MNQTTIFERQSFRIGIFEEKNKVLKDSIAILNQQLLDTEYFDLLTNDAARTYFEKLGMEPEDVANDVQELIYEYNLQKGGNPLVPFGNMNGEWRINRVKFLNHRWVIADCSDGRAWGEVWIEYFFDQNDVLDLITRSQVLYP